jgi:hypothetical protein
MCKRRYSLDLSLLPQILRDAYYGREFFSPKYDTHLVEVRSLLWTGGHEMRHYGQRRVTELADSHEGMQVKSHQGAKYEPNGEWSGSRQYVWRRTLLPLI